jgi:hypothetical protein
MLTNLERWSPPVVVDTRNNPSGRIHIVREDLLLGGTKQRAAIPFLSEIKAAGLEEVVYASPFCGFAQVALAVCARHLGMKAKLFVEQAPCSTETNAVPHEFTLFSQTNGASITLAPTLEKAEQMACDYAAENPAQCFKAPLGFCHPRFVHFMGEKVAEQYENLCKILERKPRRIWLPVGSGTLARIFNEIVDADCELICVDVHVLRPEDHRIRELSSMKRIRLLEVSERFREPACELPPLPSNVHYDAKLWRLILGEAQDGDLWWNVAK